MEKLNTYAVYVKLFVLGESEMDALETTYSAVDGCDLLDQDGVVGIEVIDEVEEADGDEEYSNEEE